MTGKESWLIAIVALLAAGCVTIEPYDYTAMRRSDPKSVLVVPVINNTVDVTAPDLFLSTIAKPLVERGYYVFPVNTVREMLADQGLSDVNMIHAADPRRLAKLFGADAVLYIAIDEWTAKYIVLSTTITVAMRYELKDGRTGETLWAHAETINYNPSNSSSSGNPVADLIVMAASAAIHKAFPEGNLLMLSRQANTNSLYRRKTGLPAGPYHAQYGEDRSHFPVHTQ